MNRIELVRRKLREIEDPCSVSAGRPVDIVAMGLIGNIEDDGGNIRISLVLTEPVCWFSKNITDTVEEVVGQLSQVRSVEAFLDNSEIWTPERMEASARQILR